VRGDLLVRRGAARKRRLSSARGFARRNARRDLLLERAGGRRL
jgi:hypothetical protein